MRKTIPQSLRSLLLSAAVFLAATVYTHAQPVLSFNNFILSGLSSPVDITNAKDGTGRLFIVEQGGRIKIHNGFGLLATPFLNISTLISTGGERGLLSLAFHPNYSVNGFFFVYYTNLSGDITIARYQVDGTDPNLANAASGVVLMTIPKPFSNHNGGDLNFGPDGYLYFGTGDGGGGGDPNNFAQNGLSLLGKMIRIDVNSFLLPPYYIIPADNPYVADPLVDDHIWTIGMRNPWRWSFDRLTNDMWIADVGQGAWEEVNFRAAGTTGGINYGWRCYEGNAPYNTTGCLPQSNYISPIFVYPHNITTGGFSITGGFVYRGAEYPLLYGYYICADYVSGNVWIISPDGLGGWTTLRQAGLPGSISSFGEAEDGTLYAVGLNGRVYKVASIAILPVSLLSFTGTRQTGYNELEWQITATQNTERFIIEYSGNSIGWQEAGAVTAQSQQGNQVYNFRHYTNITGKLYYRLRIVDNNGSYKYSQVIVINSNDSGSIKIYPTVITDNQLKIVSEKQLTGIRIMDANGRIVMSKPMNRQQGYITVPLPALSSGAYWVQVLTDVGNEVVKVVVR